MNKFSAVAVLTLGGLLAFSTLATAQEAKEGKDKGGKRAPGIEQQLERMTTDLKLTDAQKPKVKAVLEESMKKRQALRDVPQDQRREKMRAATEEQQKKMKEILTSEQFEKWQKQRQEMRRNRPGGPNAPGGEKKSEEKKTE
jgi:Spy/CpxP family protein refolding chaperone